MKNTNIWGGALIVVLIGLGFWTGFFNMDKEEGNTQEYSVEKEGLLFEYKTGSDGYVVDDLSASIVEQPSGTEILARYRIMNSREKAELETSDVGREGPPSIHITIYRNMNNHSASMWVDGFTMLSNIHLALGTPERDAVVGGANAVLYRADGLYLSDNVVVAHGGRIYHFAGEFLEEGSAIHNDFKDLIDSVVFIQAPGEGASQAKIDIRVACESALAYMTFETGDDADAFVASCIDGKHPEVIERYISDMNLDGTTI